jgi:SulP family sulfate permease
MVLASFLPALPWFQGVQTVGDITEIPSSLPEFGFPALYDLFSLVLPAVAIAIIGLVQGAGIGQLYPNPDGKYPDASGDFVGQGAANVATSFFEGMPAGGSVSGTALIIGSGGISRLANVMVGVLIAAIVLAFAGVVKLIAMPALAGLLLVIGVQTLKPQNMRMVWHTGQTSRVTMLITFVATLVMPLQYAVFLGVSISILLQIGRQADKVKLVEFVRGEGGLPIEQAPPKNLSDSTITILYIYGSLFYAAAKNLEGNLPEVGDARRPVVIFLMRGHDELGSTMMTVLDRYARSVQMNDGLVMFAGVSEDIRVQMERTGLLRLVGEENTFLAHEQWGIAANDAIAKAEAWLASSEDQDRTAN